MPDKSPFRTYLKKKQYVQKPLRIHHTYTRRWAWLTPPLFYFILIHGNEKRFTKNFRISCCRGSWLDRVVRITTGAFQNIKRTKEASTAIGPKGFAYCSQVIIIKKLISRRWLRLENTLMDKSPAQSCRRDFERSEGSPGGDEDPTAWKHRNAWK